MGVGDVFLPECPLVLSLLKLRVVEVFLNQRNDHPELGNPLK